jgi:hypothetical protein
LILVPSLLTGGEATSQLSATIDAFVPIITNTPSAELQANGFPESARKLVLARFDFLEMTRRSLGRHLYAMAADLLWQNRALLTRREDLIQAAELVPLNVDMFVVAGSSSALATKKVTQTIR